MPPLHHHSPSPFFPSPCYVPVLLRITVCSRAFCFRHPNSGIRPSFSLHFSPHTPLPNSIHRIQRITIPLHLATHANSRRLTICPQSSHDAFHHVPLSSLMPFAHRTECRSHMHTPLPKSAHIPSLPCTASCSSTSSTSHYCVSLPSLSIYVVQRLRHFPTFHMQRVHSFIDRHFFLPVIFLHYIFTFHCRCCDAYTNDPCCHAIEPCTTHYSGSH
ncbi:hypothetical protein BC826DRAFT_1023070 [Russula brevipes]|nr:hypothetical protein BC826DRAFT_1023070 [Russula brevipes]